MKTTMSEERWALIDDVLSADGQLYELSDPFTENPSPWRTRLTSALAIALGEEEISAVLGKAEEMGSGGRISGLVVTPSRIVEFTADGGLREIGRVRVDVYPRSQITRVRIDSSDNSVGARIEFAGGGDVRLSKETSSSRARVDIEAIISDFAYSVA